MTDRYVELHSASAFSFLEGASQPEELAKRAVELEMPAMALLDRNGVYGSARFHTSAKRNDVHAHVGAEIAVSSFGNRLTPPAWRYRTCIPPNPRGCPCCVSHASATRIFVSSSPISRCGREPNAKVRRPSTTCRNTLL